MRTTLALSISLLLLAGCGGGSTDKPVRQPGAVVLGSPGHRSNHIHPGWGEARPWKLDAGGDPAQLIFDIHWRNWGKRVATGVGHGPAFHLGKGGTYYKRQVRAEIRAYRLGRCSKDGPRAYTALKVRMPDKPGGPMGPWLDWGYASRGVCSYL